MKNILIIAKNNDVCSAVSQLLTELEFNKIVTYTSGAVARGIDTAVFDIIIVSMPLSDEYGLDLVAAIYKNTKAGIVVLAKKDIAEEVQKKLNFTGAYVLPRPFSKAVFLQTIKFSEVAKSNLIRLEQEKEELSQQLQDLKLINRAKALLMEYLKLSEEQAHRHIQKQAMDLRKTQRAVAEDILITYQNKR